MVEKLANGFRGLLIAAALASGGARVAAHPVDEFVQATLVAVEPGAIRFQMNLTPGTAMAERVLALIDRDRDGLISTNEAAAYAELVRRDLAVRLDGREVELKLAALNFPEPAEMRTGWGIIQLEYSLTTGSLAGGPHKLAFNNRHHPVASAYLLNAGRPESAAVKITGQRRNEDQSSGEIDFDFQPSAGGGGIAGIFVPVAGVIALLLVGVWGRRRRQSGRGM